MILELRDKLKEEYLAEPAVNGKAPAGGVPGSVAEGAVGALMSLGYRETEVRGVVAGMGLTEQDTLEATVARALKALDRQR